MCRILCVETTICALIFCYHLKKSAAESHRMLVEDYGEHALGKSQCFKWFKKFKSGDFDEKRRTWKTTEKV